MKNFAGLLIGTLLASPAWAQSAPAADVAATARDAGDIVVTARKRDEKLQDVPLSITALGAAALDRQQIRDVTDLTLAAPSVVITQTGGSANAAQIFIRGFGQDALGFNSESPVGVYFDDVYLGRVQGSLLDVLDIERIEILRGPQGTLYGRNSTTGAVRFVVRAPDLNDARLLGEVTVGSFERIDVRASASVPIVAGKLAAKLDIVSRNNRGWYYGVDATGVENGLRNNGNDRQLIRAALRWTPSETVTVDLAGDLSRDRSGVLNSTPIVCVAGANSACTPRYGNGNPRLGGINYPGVQRSNARGASGKITVDLGFAQLKSVTAYRGFDGIDPIDLATIPGAPSPITYDQQQDQFSQELQLVSSSGGTFDFAAGLYYFHEKWTTDTNFVNLRRNVDTQTANSYAAYGEVYVRPLDRLTLTLGGRVTRDDKTISRQIYSPRTAATPTVSIIPPRYEQTVFTPKVAIDFKPSDDILLYASWSRGYRPGGYGNTWPGNAIAAAGVFEAEKATSYEAGIKTSFLERRATLNLAAYRIEYSNLQQGQLTPTAFVVTSSDARVQGVEAEATLRPIPGLSLFGNVGILDDKITRSNIPGDNLARRLRYAPKATFKVGADLRLPVTDGGAVAFANVNFAHQSSTAQDQVNSLGLIMPAYGLLDAQIGFEAAEGRYRIAVGAKNLTDKDYWRSGIAGQGRFYGPPRTLFVQLSTKL